MRIPQVLTILIVGLSSTIVFGQQGDKTVRSYFTTGPKYQKPKLDRVIEASISEIEDDLAGRPSKTEPVILDELKKNGSSINIIKEGRCDGKPNDNCQSIVVTRKYINLPTSQVKAVADIYTTDLRYAKDKIMKVAGVTIDRQHWELNGSTFIKTERPLGPFEINKEYVLKKCRDSLMVPWRCNLIEYKMIALNGTSFLVIGQLLKPDNQPNIYKIPECSEEKEKCSKNFNNLQIENSSAGLISMAAIKLGREKGEHTTVYEINLAGIEKAADLNRAIHGKTYLESMVTEELNVLTRKFLELTEVHPVTAQTPAPAIDDNNTSSNLIKIIFLCLIFIFAIVTIYSSTKGLTPILDSEPVVASNSDIKRQRQFLHEISDPIAVCQGMIDLTLANLKKSPENNKNEIDRLERAAKSLTKVVQAIVKKRNYLIASSVPEQDESKNAK